MSGQHRLILADMARKGNPKGSALKSAVKSAFSQEKIKATCSDKQPLKGKKK